MALPVVIAANGRGLPVIASEHGLPVVIVEKFGLPVVFVEDGRFGLPVVVMTVTPPDSAWLLAGGSWADAGIWIDTENWMEAA